MDFHFSFSSVKLLQTTKSLLHWSPVHTYLSQRLGALLFLSMTQFPRVYMLVAKLLWFLGRQQAQKIPVMLQLYEKPPHENTQRQLFYTFQYPFFPSSNKEDLWSITCFLKPTAICGTLSPTCSPSLFPFFSPSLLPQSSDTLKIPASWWGTNCFHKEPEASFLRLLSKISGLLCSTQGLGVYTLIFFFNSCKNFLLIYLYLKRKAHIFPIHVNLGTYYILKVLDVY